MCCHIKMSWRNCYDEKNICYTFFWSGFLVVIFLILFIMGNYQRLPSALTDGQTISDHFGNGNPGFGGLPIKIKDMFPVKTFWWYGLNIFIKLPFNAHSLAMNHVPEILTHQYDRHCLDIIPRVQFHIDFQKTYNVNIFYTFVLLDCGFCEGDNKSMMCTELENNLKIYAISALVNRVI